METSEVQESLKYPRFYVAEKILEIFSSNKHGIESMPKCFPTTGNYFNDVGVVYGFLLKFTDVTKSIHNHIKIYKKFSQPQAFHSRLNIDEG